MIAGKSEDEVIRAFVGDPEASRLMTFAETVEERAAHLSSVEPRRVARTWDESITALDQSRWFFDRSFLSSTACNFSQTPASFQADRRRQQVTRSRSPSPGAGTPTGFPVCSTNGMPHNACRSRDPRSAFDLLRPRLRQQRLDQRPQFIREDPRPRMSLHHTNDPAARQPHDQQLLLQLVGEDGADAVETMNRA
ncbi:hypothetical protein AB0M58_41865 [Streptomyces bobili]|uniref:hypothetical protein n=1 Tax=Streptomyces bobili TaxID=67280 RepID=UPI003415C28B